MSVRELVWNWLISDGRPVLLYSEVTKGLCGPHRKVARLASSPRQAVRDAVDELAADGLVRLHPVGGGGRGRPGLRIHVLSKPGSQTDNVARPPKDGSTQGGVVP